MHHDFCRSEITHLSDVCYVEHLRHLNVVAALPCEMPNQLITTAFFHCVTLFYQESSIISIRQTLCKNARWILTFCSVFHNVTAWLKHFVIICFLHKLIIEASSGFREIARKHFSCAVDCFLLTSLVAIVCGHWLSSWPLFSHRVKICPFSACSPLIEKWK